MLRFNPFRAIRPATADLAATIASVPYDVVNREEAAKLAEGNPLSFLHVCRADIDLPAGTDPHDDRVYAKAKENLDSLVARGALVADKEAGLYVYRLEMGGKAQVGIVGCVHVDDYEADVLKKHEKTRRDKEDDRTRHVLTMNANAEPVFLTYRPVKEIDVIAAKTVATNPIYDFTAPDGVRHTVWKVADHRPWVEAFAKHVPAGYVADGHHRCASAWRAGKERRAANPRHTGKEEYNWFLAVLFPSNQLRILPYNRLVKDLKGKTPGAFLDELRRVGKVSPTTNPVPARPGTFCVYLAKAWHLVEVPETSIERGDPIDSLDVAILESRVLEPILGIADVRTDKRIDFVGGIRGPRELERRVESGEMAVGFSMHATTLDQLMTVADAGKVMPPKSTWFEPKLRSGLFVHTLD